MKHSNSWLMLLATSLVAFTKFASAQQPLQLAGAQCANPPVLHCPDKDCPGDRVINQGPSSR